MASTNSRPSSRGQGRAGLVPTGDERTKIAALIREAMGLDLRAYKSPTITRRIIRRLNALKIRSVADYIARLKSDKNEARLLCQDALIHVTGFFRDPHVFRALQTNVIPDLLRNRKPDRPLRFWVPGCSTGEEVYSFAITALQCLGKKNAGHVPIQIFGSDVSENALAVARKGIYRPASTRNLRSDYLERYFMRVAQGYQVDKRVRGLCTFAKQDIVQDPPFSHIDLISCRNVLIYLSPEVQNRIINLFHYALKPDGILVMGRSETIGAFFPELFVSVDKRNNIYRKRPGSTRPSLNIPSISNGSRLPARPAAKVIEHTDVPVHREAERILINRFAPPSVLVNGAMEILHTHGDLTPFLRLTSGKPSFNVLKMAREPMMVELRLAIAKARRTGRAVHKRGLAVQGIRRIRPLTLSVIPVDMPVVKERYFLIAFEEETQALPPPAFPKSDAFLKAPRAVQFLRKELSATKTYLQSVMEEHEQTTQELRSANEEVLSSNEELQSTNEEMETAKEELESTNEELTTVNEELAARNAELKESLEALEDVKARLNEAQAIAHIGSWVFELEKNTFHFSDELYRINGLPIEKAPFTFGRFLKLVHPDDRTSVERTLREAANRKSSFEMEHRILRADGEIRFIHKMGHPILDKKGRVLRLIGTGQDVTEKRAGEAALRAAHEQLERRVEERTAALNDANRALQMEVGERRRIEEALRRSERLLIDFYDSAPVAILWVDGEGRVARVNQSFLQLVGLNSLRTVGRRVREFFKSPADADGVLNRLKNGETLESSDILLEDNRGSVRHGLLSANTQVDENGRFRYFRWFIRDATARKAAEDALRTITEELREKNDQLRHSNEDLEQFAYVTSHDLQEPLRKIYTYLDLIKPSLGGIGADADRQKALAHIERIQASALRMKELIDDLLNFSRIKTTPRAEEKVDLNAVVKDVLHDLDDRISQSGAAIRVDHLPTLRANGSQMRQLFQNLIANSIKFVEPGQKPAIRVTLHRDGKWHEIALKDNGIGFDEQYLDRIFKPFQRLHRKEHYEGTGIGLAICQKIVQHHGGTITATSKPGQGATFFIRLPVDGIGADTGAVN